MSVREAVENQLEQVRRLDADLADGVFAALALALAEEIDSDTNKAMSTAACATELRQTWSRLVELLPAEERKGALHDIRSGHASRLRVAQGGSGSED